MNTNGNLEFLFSNRFWMLVLLAAAVYLKSAGFTLDANALAEALMTLSGGFVTVRTADRFSEKMGANSGITIESPKEKVLISADAAKESGDVNIAVNNVGANQGTDDVNVK